MSVKKMFVTSFGNCIIDILNFRFDDNLFCFRKSGSIAFFFVLLSSLIVSSSFAQLNSEDSATFTPKIKEKILFDQSHNQFWTACADSGLADYVKELGAYGYQVDILTDGPITYNKLKEYDVLAFPNGFVGKDNFEEGVKLCSQDEIYAISQFVYEGGGLVLFECGWSWVQYTGLPIDKAPINQIGNVFGITLNEDIIHDPTNFYVSSGDGCPIFYKPYIKEHPITKDVNQISNCEGIPSSLSISDSSVESLITGDEDAYSDKYSAGQLPIFLAATNFGSGRVVFFGQTGIISSTDGNNDGIKNIYEYDNLKLGLNIMDWLVSGSGIKTITWSNHVWNVKSGGPMGPGNNYWSPKNVWVDSDGNLHLRISKIKNSWYCAEVWTEERLHFGKYLFWVIGPIDQLDRNVVFGMFNYPPLEIGPDKTNEIDIEIARWGNQDYPNGNYAVWPNMLGIDPWKSSFPFVLSEAFTTHRFVWQEDEIYFQSLLGHKEWSDSSNEITDITTSSQFAQYIPKQPLPIHINLWLFEGSPPSDDKPVEVVIKKFTYTPI